MSNETKLGRKGMEKSAKWRKADTGCYEEFVKHLRSEVARGYFYSFHKFVSGHQRLQKKKIVLFSPAGCLWNRGTHLKT